MHNITNISVLSLMSQNLLRSLELLIKASITYIFILVYNLNNKSLKIYKTFVKKCKKKNKAPFKNLNGVRNSFIRLTTIILSSLQQINPSNFPVEIGECYNGGLLDSLLFRLFSD